MSRDGRGHSAARAETSGAQLAGLACDAAAVTDRERLVDLWARVESDLRAALSLSTGLVPKETALWVEQFLDHNELGLGFEALVDALLEVNRVTLPDGVYPALVRARDEMQLSYEPWDRLAGLLRFLLASGTSLRGEGAKLATRDSDTGDCALKTRAHGGRSPRESRAGSDDC